MKRIILIISISAFTFPLFAQNAIEQVLTELEKNNTTLTALRKSVDAEKLGNKTGIYLQNPEVEFNYLWGNPSLIGNRTDISIRQTFDFPTAYSYRNQISNFRNEQAELEYNKQRKSILLQARLICIDLVFTNAVKSELSKRLLHSQRIADSYKAKFNVGETNILEFNRSQLNLLNLSKELETVELNRNELLAELASLNGGIPIEFIGREFQPTAIPVDFEQWYVQAEQNNPVLKWLKQEIELRQKQEKLNAALSLPKLQAGYMSEKVVGEHFQGITLGISIPLYENKNAVKYAKAQTIAAESIEKDNKLQFYTELKKLHAKAIDLQKSLNDYRENLKALDSSDLVAKALDKGQIELIDYILELSIYYQSVNQMLESERNLNKVVAELNQYL
jgi:cobalt-zinc-cadmium efflux system outer membrane protein